MKTIKGYEAIEIAEKYDLEMYDLYYKNPLSVEEVKQFIRSRRDPQTFALQNWPDTDQEADQMVLNAYHVALKDHLLSAANLDELDALGSGLPLNPGAAELAAERLAASGKLEILEETRDGIRYRIPRTLYFRGDFLDALASQVCDECARLDIDGPFHETCLLSLFEYLREHGFTPTDVTEVRHASHGNHKFSKILRPGIELLSKTVSETRSKLQSVVKPIFNQDEGGEEATPTDSTVAYQSDIGDETIVYRPEVESEPKPIIEEPEREEQHEEEHPVGDSRAQQLEEPLRESVLSSSEREETEWQTTRTDRARITKEELIEYLRQIEIIDDTGEIVRLQRERSEWLQRMAERERDIEQLERQRAYWETQYHEMNRDMDTMIEAMQIAKRRVGRADTTLIDADVQTGVVENRDRLR
jgi:hypothetical protein